MSEAEVKQVSIGTVDMRSFKEAREKGVLSIEQKAPPVEAEADAAGGGGGNDDEGEEKKAAAAESDEKPKGKGGGFQKRIDRLVKHNATLEERAAAAEKERDELKAKGTVKAEPEAKAAGDAEPKLEYFKTHEEWVKAQAKWEVRQELKAQSEREQKEAEAAAQKEVFDAYNAKVSEARAKYDDFDAVVGNPKLQIPMNVQLAIIEMENGPDVAYHLGSNPELCEELKAMSPLRAVGKIWRVAEDLTGEKKSEEKEEVEEKEEAEAKTEEKPKLVSKAAPPIKPLGAGTSKSTVPLDKMDMKQFKAARAAGRVS